MTSLSLFGDLFGDVPPTQVTKVHASRASEGQGTSTHRAGTYRPTHVLDTGGAGKHSTESRGSLRRLSDVNHDQSYAQSPY